MDEQIANIIRKHYPEIGQGWHVPAWATVTTINENSNEGDLSDPFRPRYAVSLKLLDKSGNETLAPEMQNIGLAGSFSASGGIMQLPEPGAIVELSFAFGQINKPYISNILPYGMALAACRPGELVMQARKGASMRIDESGNISQETDKELKQISSKLKQLIGHIETKATSKSNDTRSHVIENVGGKYQLTSLGALIMLTTGHAELSALESINFTTASDLNENVVGKKQALVGELISYQVEDGGKINIGSKTVNTIDILYQLANIVNQLATTLSTHTHGTGVGPTTPPVESGDIAGQAAQANTLATKVKPLLP